jgi:two-component sensor histidine kinase
MLRIVFCLLMNIIPWLAEAQLVDITRARPYQQVFTDTYKFDGNYLVELENSLSLPLPDSVRLPILNDLGYYYHTRNLKKALGFIQLGLDLADSTGNAYWQGRLAISKGAVLLRMEKLDEAENLLKAAFTKVRPEDQWLLLTNLGYVYERRGNLGEASSYAIQTLKLGEKIKQPKAIAMAYSDISNLYWKQKKYTEGLEIGLRSLDIFRQAGITDLDYDFTLYVVGNNYLALNDNTKALSYYKQSIELGERYGFYNNLSDVYISLTDLYTYLQDYTNAETAGLNSIKYAQLLENNFMLMRSWLSVGKMQNQRKDFVRAQESLLKCIAIASEIFGDKFYLHQAYQELSMAYAGQKNYEMAFKAFEKHDKLEDAVFTADADERIARLSAQFELAKKENTITLQQSQLKQQRNIQFFSVVIGLILILFLLFLYRTYLKNKKTNSILAKQNREKEFLLKEIHHRVKNNLEVVSSLLSLQSGQSETDEIKDVMIANQNRVHSMSMIHQKLYQGDNIGSIDMKDYFMNLGNYMLSIFNAHDRINIDYRMDATELDGDTAVPIGLIVNELLTNALKYAFPGNRKGNIFISLHRKNKTLTLEVGDDGVGKKNGNAATGSGFGTQLIELLTLQLDGKMSEKKMEGTQTIFEFQLSHA